MSLKQKLSGYMMFVVLMIAALSACAPKENSDKSWSVEDIDGEYTPFASATGFEKCKSLEGVNLSIEEATPFQVVNIGFDCIVDDVAMSVSLDGETLDIVQVSPTIIAVLIPENAEIGGSSFSLSAYSESVELPIVIIPGEVPPADPNAYLQEVMSYIDAMIEEVDDPLMKERMHAIMVYTEAEITALGPEAAELAAGFVFANESALGLQDKSTCSQYTKENWWKCYRPFLIKQLSWATLSAGAFGLGFKALGSATPLAVAGVVVGSLGALVFLNAVRLIIQESWSLALFGFQVLEDKVQTLFNKENTTLSGESFVIAVKAEYTTLSGATLGGDATDVSAFIVSLNEMQDLVLRINKLIGTDLKMYSLNELPHDKAFDVDPEFLSIALSPQTDSAISASISGMEVTLKNSSSETLPARLIVTYDFPGVRTLETMVDIVVEPVEFGFTQVSTGPAFTCAVTTGADILCWGVDTAGQSSPPPGNYTYVAGAGRFACGIKTDQSVVCWGNEHELAQNTGQTRAPAGKFTKISASLYHVCGLTVDGSVVCWGAEDMGDEDNRADHGQANPPAGSFIDISTASSYSCGVRAGGKVECWGLENNHFNSSTYNQGQLEAPDGNFVQVSAGPSHACGLKTDGTVECWGSDEYLDNLGNPFWRGRATPPDSQFTQVSASERHSCGVSVDGDVICWGVIYNMSYGEATSRRGDFVQVSTGDHNCAVSKEGSITCWGKNDYGQTDVPDGI